MFRSPNIRVIISITAGVLGLMGMEAAATEAGFWAPDSYNGVLLRCTPAGSVLYTIPGFDYPTRCAIDPRNNDLWVIDGNSGYVTKLTSTGSILASTYVGIPADISLNPYTGNVWIANYTANEVVKLSSGGSILVRVPNIAVASFVAVDPRDGSCWTCDRNACELIKISAAGSIVFRKKPVNSPHFNFYSLGSGIVEPATGNLYVGSMVNYLIKLTPDGDEIWRYPNPATPNPWFGCPQQIRLDPVDGTIWAAQSEFRVISRLSPSGTIVINLADLRFQPWGLSVCYGDRSVLLTGMGGGSQNENFMKLSYTGEKLIPETHIGGSSMVMGVAAYPGCVEITPTSLGTIRALYH